MPPKGKGKAPEQSDRQPTVEPEESDESTAVVAVTGTSSEAPPPTSRSKVIQTPKRMNNDAFNELQEHTLTQMIRREIRQAFQEYIRAQADVDVARQIAARTQSASPSPASLPRQQEQRQSDDNARFHTPGYDVPDRQTLVVPEPQQLKVKDIGLFHPPDTTSLPEAPTTEGGYTVYHDVFSFVDALRLWPEQDVCRNLLWKNCLRGSALNWWTTELSDLDHSMLRHAPLEIICRQLTERFKMPASIALEQLYSRRFGYPQIRAGTHLSEHLATCFRLAKHADFSGDYHILLTTWNTLDGVIKQTLGSTPPTMTTTRSKFMADAREHWPTIYELAMRFKPSPQQHSLPQSNPYATTASTSLSANRPSASTSKPYIQRTTPPQARAIENRAYLGYIDDGTLTTTNGGVTWMGYEPAESPNRETDVD